VPFGRLNARYRPALPAVSSGEERSARVRRLSPKFDDLVCPCWPTTASQMLPGRPVMITFDDGYADFYETAWPILQRNGFSAHNFVVTDLVGRCAEWDARWGAPAPLMDWAQIIQLSAEGATFGSHLATHTAATYMRTEALLREAVNSRLKLEKALGTPIETVATPFGDSNGVVELVLKLAGYRQHFGNHLDCFAPISSNWMSIPRLFVTSDLNIQAFANLMGLYEERPEAADRPRAMMVVS
jgi:peptidoglycan/xylan/chitin deacetylase (PgdA/CDA1 family)